MKFSRKKDSRKSTEEGSTSIPTVSEKVEEEDFKKRKKKSSKKGSTSGKKETIRLACVGWLEYNVLASIQPQGAIFQNGILTLD